MTSPLDAPSISPVRSMPLSLVVVFVLSGCSALFVRTPSPTSPPPHDCSGRYTASTIDAVVATASMVGGIYAFANRDTTPSEHSSFDPNRFVLGPLLLTALVFGMSAVHGYTASNRCSAIDRAWTAQGSPPPLPPPPPPRGAVIVAPTDAIRQKPTTDEPAVEERARQVEPQPADR